jgi:hypothetical protein
VELKNRVEKFLADSPDPLSKNPHIYVSVLEDLLVHDDLLELGERVVKTGIEANTIDNLRLTLGDATEDLEQEQDYVFARLYSNHAWIQFRTDRQEQALESMQRAFAHINNSGVPRASDILRLGLIEYENGMLEEGWNHIGEALLLDGSIERRNAQYRAFIDAAIADMQGTGIDPDDYIWEHRRDNRKTIHGLAFTTLDGETIELDNERGKVVFLTFFSPMCMSCREEVPCLKTTYEELSSRGDIRFLFILNRPDLVREAKTFFVDCGIPTTLIATKAEGSAYDLIATEPTVWIADKSGRIVTKLTGSPAGNEEAYRKELMKVIAAAE